MDIKCWKIGKKIFHFFVENGEMLKRNRMAENCCKTERWRDKKRER